MWPFTRRDRGEPEHQPDLGDYEHFLDGWEFVTDPDENGVQLTTAGTYVIGCDQLFDTSGCGNSGEVDCVLCDREDPNRFVNRGNGDECIDCGEPPDVIGSVDCPDCEGRGYLPCDEVGNTG